MKRFYVLVTALVFTGLMVGLAGPAHAQLAQEADFPDERNIDISVNSGVLIAAQELAAAGILGDVENIFDSLDSDDVETAFGLSGDLVYRFDSGVRFGGQIGWSPMSVDFDAIEVGGETIEIDQNREFNLYLYSFTVGYTYSLTQRLGVIGSAGLGGATQAFKEDTLLVNGEDIYNDDSNTSFHTPLTLGVRYALTRSIAIDVLARNSLIYGNDDLGGTTNNFYFAGGVSYIF